MRDLKVPLLSIAALSAVALLGGSGVAQVVTAGQPRNDAGFGTIKRSFNISSRVRPGNNGNNDVRITSAVFLKGKTYVSSDNDRADHRIYVLDDVGNYESFFDLGANIAELTVLYDMASDGESLIVAVGEGTGGTTQFENEEQIASHAGIYVFDTQGNLVDQLIGDNGPRAITNPIRGDGYAHMKSFHYDRANSDEFWDDAPYRGVAFDPSGDGGNGSLWVSTDGGLADGTDEGQPTGNAPILEIDLDGAILTELQNGTEIDMEPLDLENLTRSNGTSDPNPRFGMPKGGVWVGAGLALDNQTGNLWVLQNDDEQIIEVDSATGIPTGNFFTQERFTNGFRGGLDGILGGDPGSNPADFDMLVLSRINGDDHIAYQRMNLYPSFPGVDEPFLSGGINGSARTRFSPIIHSETDTLDFGIELNGNSASPAVLFINFGAEASSDVPTLLPPLGLIPELRAYSLASSPPTAGSALLVPTATGVTTSVDLGAINFPSVSGQHIRLQGVYFDVRSQYSPGIIASSELWFTPLITSEVLFEAVGPAASNADRSSGFFRVHWLGGGTASITEVRLDFSGSRRLGQNGRFDVDDPNMSDSFGLGNSGLPGAMGTYRNDSDTVTGLVYDMMNHNVDYSGSAIVQYYVESQGHTWNSGFMVDNSDPGSTTSGGTGDHQTLIFRFTDFGLDGGVPAAAPEIFEFDCAVQGTPGTDGGAVQSLVVTITMSDGRVFQASTVPDVTNPERSFWGF